MKKNKLVLCIVTFVIILLSCRTTNINENTNYVLSDILIEDVEELLENENFLEAIQYIHYLKNENNIDVDLLDEYHNNAVSSLNTSFENSLETENYEDAYSYYLSIFALSGNALFPDISEKKILLNIADKYYIENQYLISIIFCFKALRLENVTEEDYLYVLNICLESKNFSALKYTIKQMEKKGISVPPQYMQESEIKLKKSELMQGTATIWVDRGTKIERGIGFSDISMGSGFFIDKRGYLLTNYHVIESEVDPEYEGFSRLYIRLPGKMEEKIPAKVIGWDKVFDIALLKTEVTPEYAFTLGGEIEIEAGQKVYVIGSPLDPLLESTITSGIISSTERRHFLQLGNVIQIDAAVNPGNSGGPLLTEDGEIIGVVFAGMQQFQGLNFAIPIKWIIPIIPELFKGDEITHSWLGLGLVENENELEVIYTIPGESAQKSGIQTGDIIKSINGIAFKKVQEIQEYILKLPSNTLVNVVWEHETIERNGLILLKDRPFSPIELALKRDAIDNIIYPLFGMKLLDAGDVLWSKKYRIENIVLGSIADNSGMSIDDVLTIKKWLIDPENHLAIIQIIIKKKKEGYIQSTLQLAALLEMDIFL